MRTITLALTAIALAACAKTGTTPADTTAASGTAASATTEDVGVSVGNIRDAWVAAANKKDAATVSTFYTDDAVLVTNDSPVASGRDAIKASFAKSFPTESDLKVNSEKVESSGDLAVDYGTFSQHVKPPKGKAMDVDGHYIVVLKRQSDGAWKIVRQMGVAAPRA